MTPWLTIIGIGENGLDGLSPASRRALDDAETVFGGPRHLALAGVGERGRAWPVPFSVDAVVALKGRKTVVLASGDPFWFGVGGTLAQRLDPDDWQAFPGVSTFSLIAARLGWRLEETSTLGLHAAAFGRLEPHLVNGAQAICLVRDGAAVGDLGRWLDARGFGRSAAWVVEAVGGPNERCQATTAAALTGCTTGSPVAVVLRFEGGTTRPRANGLPDTLFQHDGQITKRPVRALTLSALAPRPGERLWDIGAGSGSISIEWLLASGRDGTAAAIEANAERARIARDNAIAFGVEDRLEIIEGKAPNALAGLAAPNAVFIGGGASEAVLEAIFALVAPGTRIVANAVSLETEALFVTWSQRRGGDLLRIDLAHSAPLGQRRGWTPARPIVQWSVMA